MRNVAMMQIEKVGGVVAGLKERKVLSVQMLIHGFAGMEGKQEAIVGVVGVRDVESPQVESGVARHGG